VINNYRACSKKISVSHFLEDFSIASGGVPEVVRQLSKKMRSVSIASKIFHVKGDGVGLDLYDAHRFPSSGLLKVWGYNNKLPDQILWALSSSEADSKNVTHIHGVWTAIQYLASKKSFDASIPFIISTHGMLEPWLWNKQGALNLLKKKSYWHTFSYPAFKSASTIHAITPLERDNLSKLFPRANIEIIPNAVECSPYDFGPEQKIEPTILFLGRIEPKKGVDILIRAFIEAKLNKEWRLMIVGPIWSHSYHEVLQRMVSESNMGDRIIFRGSIFGEEKNELMRKSWVMAAPSFSEVIGLVNLEAGAQKLPSITTYETGLFDWADGGGILISPRQEELRDAIINSCSWGLNERLERGIASKKLILQRYSWGAILPQWEELYNNSTK
jgi:glycosyltransferase involved in cell wall biosynthesis